jgi:hypothetical protein
VIVLEKARVETRLEYAYRLFGTAPGFAVLDGVVWVEGEAYARVHPCQCGQTICTGWRLGGVR